jgi:hypothetical protein
MSPYNDMADNARDAERMDWLEKQGGVKIDYYLRDGKRVYVVSDMGWARPLGHGNTIREAIDNAAGVALLREPKENDRG